jgi:hypothetical protein
MKNLQPNPDNFADGIVCRIILFFRFVLTEIYAHFKNHPKSTFMAGSKKDDAPVESFTLPPF